jgi:hypothetical protein
MRIITRALLIERLRMMRREARVQLVLLVVHAGLTIWFNYTMARVASLLDFNATVILWTVGILYFARGLTDGFTMYSSARASCRVIDAELADDAARRDDHDREDF